jgi:hypothetical protein
MIGVRGVQARCLAGAGGLADGVEPLLGGVTAVGLQRRRAAMRVFPAFALLGAQPDARATGDAIVADQHVRVDASALGVEGVGGVFRQGARTLDGAQHGLAS